MRFLRGEQLNLYPIRKQEDVCILGGSSLIIAPFDHVSLYDLSGRKIILEDYNDGSTPSYRHILNDKRLVDYYITRTFAVVEGGILILRNRALTVITGVP